MTVPAGLGYTLDISKGDHGMYWEACCYFDDSGPTLPGSYFGASDGTYSFWLKPFWSLHGKVMYLVSNNETTLRTEIDQHTDTGNSWSFGVDWDQPHRYRLIAYPEDRIEVYLDDDLTPVISIDWPTNLPVSTNKRGVIGIGDMPAYWRYLRVAMADGWDYNYRWLFTNDEDEIALGSRAEMTLKCEEINA